MSATFCVNFDTKCAFCNDDESVKCSVCIVPSENGLAKVMNTALSQINNLTNKVSSRESFLKTYNERLGQLEINSGSDDCDDHGRGSSSHHGEQKSVVTKKNTIKSRRERNFKAQQENHRSQKRKKISWRRFPIGRK